MLQANTRVQIVGVYNNTALAPVVKLEICANSEYRYLLYSKNWHIYSNTMVRSKQCDLALFNHSDVGSVHI